MDAKRERYEQIEIKLKALLATKPPGSTAEDYLTHGEYGLALEEFLGELATTDAPVKGGTIEAVGQLARLMDMDERELIDILRSP